MIAVDSLFLLLIIPLFINLCSKIWLKNNINWQELAISVVASLVVVVGIHQLGVYAQVHDTEIWNGAVTHKQKETTSCEHSYSCNCTRDKDGHQTCDTCYKHTNDYDWKVYSTAGDIEVDRIDEQGDDEPPRWTKFQKGQPISVEHSFDNYVRAVPESVINAGPMSEEEAAKYPSYPSVYDLQYVNRAINMPDQKWWNDNLAEVLKTLGPAKQVNIVMVRTQSGEQYASRMARAWLNGKQNDVIVIIGTDTTSNVVSWVKVIGWSELPLFNIQLADTIKSIGTLDRKQEIVDAIVNQINTNFVRTHMSEYDHLRDNISPPTWAIILAALLSIVTSVCCAYYFNREDVRLI